MKHSSGIVAYLLFWTLVAQTSHAYQLDENERVIPIVYRYIAIENNIPYKILYAVALVESGYTAPTNGRIRPWPWTLNFAGTPARFKTKDEALESLQQGLDSGLINIDIGLAQVNYKWNGDLLPSISQSLDPMTNLTVASRILRRELEHCEDLGWWCAVGRYHSPGMSPRQKHNAEVYISKVRNVWEQLQ